MKGCAGWVPTGENKEHILLPGCGGPRCAAVAHRVILSRVSASFSVCYVPVGTFNTANSLASARYLNSSAVLVTATVELMEDGLRYR